MDDDSSLTPVKQQGKRPNLASPYSAASPHLRKPLKATRILNEGDPNLDETCRSTIGKESNLFNTNDRNLEKVMQEEDDKENQFCDENTPPSHDQEKSMMTVFDFENTTVVTELPRDADVQLSDTDLLTALVPEVETTRLSNDLSGHLPKEEGSLFNAVYEDKTDVHELGTASDCDDTAEKSDRSGEGEEDFGKEDSQLMVLVDEAHPSNLELTSASGAEIVEESSLLINQPAGASFLSVSTEENSSLSFKRVERNIAENLSSRNATTMANETFTAPLDREDQSLVYNDATMSFVLDQNTCDDSVSEKPRTEHNATVTVTELNNDEDAVEEMEKSDMLAELPFSNKSVLECSTTSRCSRQLSDSLADFITLENQIDDELNSSGRYLLQEENEALKQQILILEDENSSLKDNLVKEAKALDIAEKERSDYKFLFEEQAGQLKESKKKLMQQRMEYENKIEEAQLGGNAVEELRHELEKECLRNSAIEEERNRLIKEVEELRTALSCREKELIQFEEGSKSVTERIARLTMESSAAAEKMELNCQELEDLQRALKEKDAIADDFLQKLQLKEQQSSVFEDMTKSQSVVIKQLENKSELQLTQISKLEYDLLQATSRCQDAIARLSSLEEEHELLLSKKTKSLEDVVSKLTHVEDENNRLKVTLDERNSVFDGMKADFLEAVNRNAEAVAHLKYEGELTKKLLSEKSSEAETLKAQLSSLLQATTKLEDEKLKANKLVQDKSAIIETLEKDKECADALMAEKMSTIDTLTIELVTERKEKIENAESLSRMALEKDKLEKELQESRRSAVNVIAPIAPVNAAEVTNLQIKIEELSSRLAQKTADAERAWKACDDMELSEADYKKRIGQLLDTIDEYKVRCGEESSPGLLDVLQHENEQPLSPFSLNNSKSDSLDITKKVEMKQSTRGSQSFSGGPSPSRKTDATNCQHQ